MAATDEVNNINNNPLLKDNFQFPPYDEIQAEHIGPGARALLKKLERELEELELTVEPEWEKVALPLEKIINRFDMVLGAMFYLRMVKDSPQLRAPMEEVQQEQVAFSLKLDQSKPIFNALKAIRDSSSWDSLSDARKRSVELKIKDGILGGIALEGDKRDRFNEIEQELAILSQKYMGNTLDSTKKFETLITHKEDIEGFPASALGLAAQIAQSKGHENATAENGPWMFTLDTQSYNSVMEHARNRNWREEVYRAYWTIASSGDFDNTTIIDQILKLKLEKAKLLGYNSFAELRMEKKMATVDKAMEFLEKLRTVSRDAAVQDMEELKEFAKSQGAPEADNLERWDMMFWRERLGESKFELKEEDFRPYFSFPKVMDGLFNLAKMLFDINVQAANGLAPVWDNDVRFYSINDSSSGSAIAYFYFDPYSRPSEKQQGAWTISFVNRSRVTSPDGISTLLPVSYMGCNLMTPVGDKPSLLTFEEVKTIFHEFGHALQHMLTRQDEGFVAGVQGIEQDARELPSQFMEYWCYHRDTLMSMAKHYETGETLPESMYEKLLAAKTFHAGTLTLKMLGLSSLDLELHTKYVPGGSESIGDLECRIMAKHDLFSSLPETRGLCNLFHLFVGGYEAGIYGYKWAEVMAADAFSAFEEVGLDNEKGIKETGQRFRETILGLGGGKPAQQVFLEFRGREPSMEALLRHHGLLVTATT